MQVVCVCLCVCARILLDPMLFVIIPCSFPAEGLWMEGSTPGHSSLTPVSVMDGWREGRIDGWMDRLIDHHTRRRDTINHGGRALLIKACRKAGERVRFLSSPTVCLHWKIVCFPQKSNWQLRCSLVPNLSHIFHLFGVSLHLKPWECAPWRPQL